MYYTYPFNLTGQPAATVCAGIAGDGMPVGLQIVGCSLSEYDVVRAAIRAHETDGLQSARFCDVRYGWHEIGPAPSRCVPLPLKTQTGR